MTRHDRIRYALNLAQEEGTVTSWYSYRPGRDKLWSLSVNGGGVQVFTVTQVEAFCRGLEAGRSVMR